MDDFSESGDVYAVDFSYPFLSGIDASKPPAVITIPKKYLDAMGNMERQYWEIKSNHYNVLIFFKKGKFYELYDCDAVIATREFGLKMVFDTTNRGKMRLAGVPEQSFSEWARLFVFRGYKVGRVEQLKEDDAEGNSPVKAKIVPRSLVEVLTPGTLTDPAMLSNHSEVFILSVAAVPNKGVIDVFAADLSRRVVYWCPCGNIQDVNRFCGSCASGQHDTAQEEGVDSVALSGNAALHSFAALLQQLHPKEIVVAPSAKTDMNSPLSPASLFKWIESEGFSAECIAAPSEAVVYKNSATAAPAVAQSPALQLLAHYFHLLRLDQELPLLFESSSTYIAHLNSTGSHLQSSVAPLLHSRTMSILARERQVDKGLVLDASTVTNLEIISNLQDGGAKHSLNFCLNHCTTNGGKRLFRSWMLRPSADAAVICARQEAVRFLIERQLSGEWAAEEDTSMDAASSQDTAAGNASQRLIGQKRPRLSGTSSMSFESHFASLLGVDFERSLSRLADMKMDNSNIAYVDPLVQYKKNLGYILTSVQAFVEMVEWARRFRQCCESSTSQGSTMPPLLEELLSNITEAAHSTTVIEALFDRQEAVRTGLLVPAKGTSPEYDAAVARLMDLEVSLHAERKRAQSEVFHGSPVEFTDLGKDLFLMEVSAANAPKVAPPGMVERARSGKSVKYVVQTLASTIEKHKQATLQKSNGLLSVLRSVACHICEQCPVLYTAASALAYFDCLMNLARLQGRYTQICFPHIDGARDDAASNSGSVVCGTDLVHPLLTTSNSVPNTIHLDSERGRVLVLTGPNMAGKSTLMRTVAVNVLLAQLGGPVFGTAMTLRPVTRVFTRIGARDATHKGQSTLFVELNETAEILRCATGRSLCLIDELGRGTSTHDGMAIAHATLAGIQSIQPCAPLTIFSTHYHALALEQERCGRHDGGKGEVGQVQLGYMDFTLGSSSLGHEGSGGDEPPIVFLYRLVPGICARSYGVEVALMAGISPTLVHLAKAKSLELTQRTALHEDRALVTTFIKKKKARSIGQ